MTERRRARWLAGVVALAIVPLGACGGDEYDDYCGAVEEHQAELTEIRAGGGPTALLGALDVFRDLQAEAPADIDDEWQQVVGRLEDLQDALDAAGVDAASYDRADPPAGVGDEERAAIEAAARALVAPETATALESLEQQARDVCKTPLSL